ncbi:MAG: hypothetical protein AB1898_32190 [Acidobacteriota bacterium]
MRGGSGGPNVAIINVLLVNPYQAVDFATNQSPRRYVLGLYGQPLLKGIWVDQCYDIRRIQDVHFCPFWTTDKPIVDFTTTRGTTFIFQRTDWKVVEDIFCWGYQVGIEFSESKYGAMNRQLTDINLDNVDIGIDVRVTQPYAVHVSNLNIANAGAGTNHVVIWGRKGSERAGLVPESPFASVQPARHDCSLFYCQYLNSGPFSDSRRTATVHKASGGWLAIPPGPHCSVSTHE